MEVVKGVHMIECTKQSHVYLIEGKQNVLVDTGFPGQGQKILDEFKHLGVDAKSIKHILLTHHDIDHIGNAKLLKDVTGACLWASNEDIPYINGEINRNGIKRIIQTIIKVEKPTIDKTYIDDQQIEDIKVIKTPGHTPGHVAFIYKDLIFTGDLFKEVSGKLNELPKFMTWNTEALKESLGVIKKFNVEWICPSHGFPFRKNASWESFINKY